MKKLFLALLLLCSLAAHAAPPAPWQVGTLVFVTDDPGDPGNHLLQFPGSPTDCTDTFSSDWCLWIDCDTGDLAGNSTYACDTAPMLYTCLAYQVTAGEAKMITNIDSDACK